MATEYATLVFKADTQEIGEAYNQLKKLNQQGKVTDKTLQSFEKQMKGIRAPTKGATGALGGMGRSAGQAGIQIQQLVGQVQAGTNPMVALSQQAADLGIVLGAPLLGAVAGIAAAFASALIPSLFNSKDAAEELTESINDMFKSFGEMTPAVRRFVELDLQQQLREQQIAAKDAEVFFRRHARAMKEDADSSEESINKLIELQATRDLATAKAEALEEQLKELRDTTDEENEAVARLTEALEEEAIALAGNSEDVLKYKLIKEGATQAEIDYALALLRSNEAIKANADAEKEREQFTTRLRKAAVQKTEQLRKEEAQKQKDRIAEEMADRQAADQAVMDRLREMEAAEADLRSAGLLDAERDEYDSYNRRKEMLEQHYNDRLITEREYQEAKKNLEKQAQDAAIGQLGEGLNALAQYNESAFKAAKAFNLANAIMNTYTGATKALATYPPPFNFIAAAGVVASGLAQVAAIRSQTYQGRALGGQVRAGESYVVGERGPEVLTMGSGGRITPNEALSKAGEGQQVSKVANISFNISTVDARGFDQLLQSRRGQIINMVNTAMNDQGRRGVA